MDNEKQKSASDYDNYIHKLGRTSTIVVLLALISVPIALTVASGASVEFGPTVTALVGALMLFGVVGVVEFISYAPIFGAGAQYLAFVTGNMMNMKIPAAVSGVKLAGVAPGTPEADVISVIATGISSLVTMGILTIGMLVGSQLLPVLTSPALAPAFSNLMPAIMGALMTPMLLKDIKTSSVPCALAVILTFVLGYSTLIQIQTFLIPVFLGIAVAWKYVLMKLEAKK